MHFVLVVSGDLAGTPCLRPLALPRRPVHGCAESSSPLLVARREVAGSRYSKLAASESDMVVGQGLIIAFIYYYR